jgi:hypothetical protein
MAAMGGHVKKSNINMANLCYLAQESIRLVAFTILKINSHWDGLSHVLWTKKMFETTNLCSTG